MRFVACVAERSVEFPTVVGVAEPGAPETGMGCMPR